MRPFMNRKNGFITLLNPVFQHMNMPYYNYYFTYIYSNRREETYHL